MKNRAGEYINNLSGVMAYKSFKPTLLPISINYTDELIKELIEANNKLAYLNALSSNIPNINLFQYMYIRKEALLSSQIEGTQCSIDDLFNPEDIKENIDVKDVLNYIKASEYAYNKLLELPLCNRLLKETHKILLKNTRGNDKNPGEFRRSQNWIGGNNSSLKTATYIPPNVDDMKEAINNLEEFINSENDTNPLINAALIHYQFETIHPFLDGNGRIGRMLVVLYLIEKDIIDTPCLYISYYLKLNRVEYYDRMSEVRRSGNYEQWIIFFLKALKESAINASDTIIKMSSLHESNINKIKSISKSNNLIKLFNYIEQYPIIDIAKTSKELELSYNTISKLINILIELRILKIEENKKRNRIFIYDEYLKILKKDTE